MVIDAKISFLVAFENTFKKFGYFRKFSKWNWISVIFLISTYLCMQNIKDTVKWIRNYSLTCLVDIVTSINVLNNRECNRNSTNIWEHFSRIAIFLQCFVEIGATYKTVLHASISFPSGKVDSYTKYRAYHFRDHRLLNSWGCVINDEECLNEWLSLYRMAINRIKNKID